MTYSFEPTGGNGYSGNSLNPSLVLKVMFLPTSYSLLACCHGPAMVFGQAEKGSLGGSAAEPRLTTDHRPGRALLPKR
jgi:hypothetical protein